MNLIGGKLANIKKKEDCHFNFPIVLSVKSKPQSKLPFCRKGLAAPDRPSNIVYSKYVIAVRQMSALYKSQFEDVSQVRVSPKSVVIVKK